VLLYGEWVEESELAPVPHRQYVFTVPRLLRPIHSRRRAWLGDLANFHPHVHVLAADGVFRADGTFISLPPVPEDLLRQGFRQAVPEFLVTERASARPCVQPARRWARRSSTTVPTSAIPAD
jgi:hypothetical protein